MEISASPGISISTVDGKSTINIDDITNENVGFYSCKAKNEIGETVSLGKLEITSTHSINPEPVIKQVKIESSKVSSEHIQKLKSKEIISETIETDEMKIQREVRFTKEEFIEVITEVTDIARLTEEPEIADMLKEINFEHYGPGIETIKELTIIGYLIAKGSSIENIKQIYNTNGFAALKQPESQFALVQLVEREGHGKLISDILVTEHVADDELLASTVGFLAFLKMIELKQTTVSEVISHLSRDDFIRQDWKAVEGKEVVII